MSEKKAQAGQRWEYGQLIYYPSGERLRWTAFDGGPGVGLDIGPGSDFPPDLNAKTPHEARSKTLAWLGSEGWEMVGVAAYENRWIETWFKRPAPKARTGFNVYTT